MALVGSLLNLTNGAALGSSPGAISQVAGSDDQAGQISMTSGTSPVAGVLCSFDLGTSYSDVFWRGNPIVAVFAGGPTTAAVAAAAACGVLSAVVTNGVHVVVNCTVAPAPSTALQVSYQIVT